MPLIEVPFIDKESNDLPDLVDTDKIDMICHPTRSHSGNFYTVNVLVNGAKVSAMFNNLENAIEWYNTIRNQKG